MISEKRCRGNNKAESFSCFVKRSTQTEKHFLWNDLIHDSIMAWISLRLSAECRFKLILNEMLSTNFTKNLKCIHSNWRKTWCVCTCNFLYVKLSKSRVAQILQHHNKQQLFAYIFGYKLKIYKSSSFIVDRISPI